MSRYLVGCTLAAPWSITFSIQDADTLTPERLKADMPRIEAALLQELERVRREAAHHTPA